MSDVISTAVLKPIMAAQVRRLRERIGKSQDELATELGVSRATINRIERGRHVPDAALLYSLADALGVDAEALRRVTEKVPLSA